MRIGYFGTPEIAAHCLLKLVERHEIAFAVTGQDKPAGRGRELKSSPVKGAALKRGIPVLHPHDLNDRAFQDELEKYGAEIFVVVAYGRIIPEEIFSMPAHKTINLHPSLLPKYRGAAPIQWALINGETETGVSVQLMKRELDAGDVVVQRKIPVDVNMTAGELYSAVLPMGAEILNEALELIASGRAAPVPQDESSATFCGKIDRGIAGIAWEKPARDIHNLVRGLYPAPAAWTTFRDKNIKILKTRVPGDEIAACPDAGCVIKHGKGRLLAGTGNGYIEILELQPETKKPMNGLSFINGYRIISGDRFI